MWTLTFTQSKLEPLLLLTWTPPFTLMEMKLWMRSHPLLMLSSEPTQQPLPQQAPQHKLSQMLLPTLQPTKKHPPNHCAKGPCLRWSQEKYTRPQATKKPPPWFPFELRGSATNQAATNIEKLYRGYVTCDTNKKVWSVFCECSTDSHIRAKKRVLEFLWLNVPSLWGVLRHVTEVLSGKLWTICLW